MKLVITRHAMQRMLQRAIKSDEEPDRLIYDFMKRLIKEEVIIPKNIGQLQGTKVYLSLRSYDDLRAIAEVEKKKVVIKTIAPKFNI
jgi:hypothetical protein